ncbi:PepSY-associated TM helix domain-containing protein [Methylosinus sporium]|uniref:PepSY-associated TM helix domain-containing protein n=1 Tax=Methylosinus sporium TaxID=428 RepID=UPI00383BD84D
MTRAFFVWLHRWIGLAMAGFLVIVGLTGSLLAFNSELERLISPQLFAQAHAGPPFDLATLAERAETLVPRGRVEEVSVTAPDQILVRMSPRDEAAQQLGFDELFLDPWTGAELGRRTAGDLSQGVVNLMPFIYDLHWRLAMGNGGFWILGILAVFWTIDCFIGFYLTMPVSRAKFWSRWKPSWLVKWRSGAFRVNFDLHRASGLWLWPMLFVFAWSSVMMDMRPVYEWVTRRVFDYRSFRDVVAILPKGQDEPPRLGWRAAQARGEALMSEQAAAHGFETRAPIVLAYHARFGAYAYEVRSSRDLEDRSRPGGATVMFDGATGALIALLTPTGQRVGNTVETWLYALHMARVFGTPYQIFVCVIGLVVAMLSGTGVVIWWKKRSARLSRKARDAAGAPPQPMIVK